MLACPGDRVTQWYCKCSRKSTWSPNFVVCDFGNDVAGEHLHGLLREEETQGFAVSVHSPSAHVYRRIFCDGRYLEARSGRQPYLASWPFPGMFTISTGMQKGEHCLPNSDWLDIHHWLDLQRFHIAVHWHDVERQPSHQAQSNQS